MSFEEGLKHEQSGSFDLALSLYIAEVKSGRTTKDAVRGLFRSTIKVGDISSLTLDLPDLCRSSGISDSSAKLMQGRLLIEIGEIEKAREVTEQLEFKHLGTSEIVELELLRANILTLEFRFDEAIESLGMSDHFSSNHLRRIAELELASHRPEKTILALKRYVEALNKKSKAEGSSKKFITASGFIFNLANQVWLEQKFPTPPEGLNLSQSMKVLSDYSRLNEVKVFDEINSVQKQEIPTLQNSRQSTLDLLIDFTSEKPSTREFSNGLPRGWEAKYSLTNKHFFVIEESGLAIATNFGICSMCEFLPEWHESLLEAKAAGRKSHIPHLSPGGSLTRFLAEMIQNSSKHAPVIIHRAKVRSGRTLLPRYST
jgi:hypothetical protein